MNDKNDETYIDFCKFNSIDSVDWEYWNIMPSWNVQEIACLLLEIDPDILDNKEKMDEIRFTTKGVALKKLTRLLQRTNDIGELADTMTPKDVIEWAQANRVFVPEGLAACGENLTLINYRKKYFALNRKYKALIKSNNNAEEREITDISPKSMRTIYHMLYIMSVNSYKFDNTTHNNAASIIEKSLDQAKLTTPKRDAIFSTLRDAWNYTKGIVG